MLSRLRRRKQYLHVQPVAEPPLRATIDQGTMRQMADSWLPAELVEDRHVWILGDTKIGDSLIEQAKEAPSFEVSKSATDEVPETPVRFDAAMWFGQWTDERSPDPLLHRLTTRAPWIVIPKPSRKHHFGVDAIESALKRQGFHLFELRANGYLLAARCAGHQVTEPITVHVHLPKNGGSSINDAMMDTFGPRYLALYTEDPGAEHDPDEIARQVFLMEDLGALASHSFRVFPSQIAGRLALYFCFLRDPVERHLSYFRYVQQKYSELSASHKRDWLPQNLLDMDVYQFLDWQMDFDRKNGLTPSRQVQYLTRTPNAQRAIDVLERFVMVGQTEQLARSLELLRRKLREFGVDWNEAPAPRSNATDTSKTPPDIDHPYLKQLDADRKLYAWGLERFERECEQYGI
ncbi:MAG: sulfotransferase family 2 domain-containing protein [Planctomycetota bacterium]